MPVTMECIITCHHASCRATRLTNVEKERRVDKRPTPPKPTRVRIRAACIADRKGEWQHLRILPRVPSCVE